MKKLIKTFKLKQSGPPRGMSRADDPYDNAWAESFWMGPPSGRLKAELNMPKGGYENLETLKTVLFEYIDGYYNDENCGSIKDEIEVYDFLSHINSGKEFFIFLEDKFHLQVALTKETSQLNEVVFFQKYFAALKRIEHEFRVSFKGIKFDEINNENENISNVTLITSVLDSTKFNQSWDKGLSLKISSNLEIFSNIINQLPATAKIHITDDQDNKLFVHDREINIGYLNHLITDPEFVRENQNGESSTSKFNIRSKSGLITLFYSKEFRGVPNTTGSFNIITDQEDTFSIYTDK